MLRRVSAVFFLSVFCSTAWSQYPNDNLGVSPRFGMLMSLSGSYDATRKMSDLLDAGFSYGFALKHHMSKHYGIEVAFDFGWLDVKPEMRIDPALKPAFVLPSITFSNIVSWPLGRVNPYVILGAGIYPWRFTKDGPRGDTDTFEGEKFQKMSIGFNAGIGLELRVTQWLALLGEARTHYLLCQDRFFFGNDFSEQSIFGIGGGFIIYPRF